MIDIYKKEVLEYLEKNNICAQFKEIEYINSD